MVDGPDDIVALEAGGRRMKVALRPFAVAYFKPIGISELQLTDDDDNRL